MRGFSALIVLVGTGAATAVATAAPANRPQHVIKPAVEARAKRIAVNVLDLPGTGWSAEPPASQSGFAPRCPYYNPDRAKLTENGAYTVSYRGDDGLYVTSTVEIFSSAKQGRAAYAAVVQPLMPRCLGGLSATASRPRGSVRLRSVGPLSLPRYGDQSTAFRIVFDVEGRKSPARTTLDVVVINRGAAEVELLFANALKERVSSSVERRVAARMAAP